MTEGWSHTEREDTKQGSMTMLSEAILEENGS